MTLWTITPGGLEAVVVPGVLLAALVLIAPVPRVLDRWGRRTLRPRVVLSAWLGWAVACSLVLVLAVGCAGHLVAGITGAVWAVGVTTAFLAGQGVCTALLLGRMRREHHRRIELIADFDETLLAWIVEDPRIVAYSIPDLREPAVVLSRGCLTLVDEVELRAVLAHERVRVGRGASLAGAVFAAWSQTVPLPGARTVVRPAFQRASERVADDAAVRLVGVTATIAALCRLDTRLPATCDGLGWSPDGATLDRVRRLLRQG